MSKGPSPSRKPRTLDDVRLDLLGADKPWPHGRTPQQRALTRILLMRPRYWLFDPDDPHYETLKNQQLRFRDLQADFFRARSVDELLDIAGELVRLEERLSAAATADALAGRVGPQTRWND